MERSMLILILILAIYAKLQLLKLDVWPGPMYDFILYLRLDISHIYSKLATFFSHKYFISSDKSGLNVHLFSQTCQGNTEPMF